MTDDSRPAPTPAVVAAATPAGLAPAPARARRRWPLFAGLAVLVVAADQLAKALVTGALLPGQSKDIVGDVVRIVFGQNSGALFGLFKDNALMFGLVSLAVIGLIVAYHARSASSLYLTVTLGLLLGGAIGNMLDRLLRGYVVDFVDVGIGPTRFYTFNVADSAISLAILLLFIAALRPALVDGGPRRTPSPVAGEPEPPAGPDDDWGDGLEPDDRPGDRPGDPVSGPDR